MSKEDLVNNYGEMLVNTSTKLVEYQQDINRYRKPVFDTEDMMDAFEAGWDAGKQEAIEYLKTILSMRSDVHPVVSEHFIKLVERAMEE